jgi:enamine deaminase RidA (YjgF/YER057c/UK114 family)
MKNLTHQAVYLAQPGANDSSQYHLVPDAAVRGNMLFTGGITGYDPKGVLEPWNEHQAARIYHRIESILEQTGFTKSEIGHWFIWAPERLTKIGPVNPYWALWFPNENDRPARHALTRALDPGVHYRVEIIGVRGAHRTSYEISEHVFHTGGSAIPGFMPWGTTMDDIIFTGPTYGMVNDATRLMGVGPDKQAELCAQRNQDLYNLSGHTVDDLLQMLVWYHDDESRAAAIRYTDKLFPNPADRPAIHYIHSKLPVFQELDGDGQFFIQYDIIGTKNARRKIVNPPGVRVMDGEGGKLPAGVASANLCFSSVLLGADPTGELPSSLEEQTANAFNAAFSVVEAAGFRAADIGHVYVWYADHAARETVDKVWARIFPSPDERPARHCVVANLSPGALVGIEITAAR